MGAWEMQSSSLLVLGGFADDPQGVLTAVDGFALMGVELLLNRGLCFRLPTAPRLANWKLRVAGLAHAQDGNVLGFLYDSQFALWHDRSLAHQGGRA
jgi:hypothetical protein